MYLTLLYTLSDIMSIEKQKKDIIFEGDSMEPYQRLRDMREDHDLTQADIARILQTTQEQISKYEIGKQMMGIDKYIRLAQYYNVSLDYLTGLIDTPRKLY